MPLQRHRRGLLAREPLARYANDAHPTALRQYSQPCGFISPGGNRTLSEAFTFKYGALPDEFNRPKAKRKTRVGVGLEIRTPDDPASEPGVFVIADVQAKGPASEAGVRPLERIVAVDGALSCSC